MVLYHKYQNDSEGFGGSFKFSMLKLFHRTPQDPLSYCCHAMEFLDKTQRYLICTPLNDRCGYKKIHGKTEDICVFCSPWFHSIWYYDPSQYFSQDKMRPGFSLGIAENTGNIFRHLILHINF